MIDAEGDYTIKGQSFKNSSFFEFYKSYNAADLTAQKELFAEITSSTGSVPMLDSHGQECILAYTPVAVTKGWTLLSFLPAKDLGADMTVSFSHNAPGSAADFAHKVNAKYLITGIPDIRPNGFVLTLHKLLPRIEITMVTKEGDKLPYSLEATKRAYA